jgi:Domain of unknown function (DUF4294)
MPRGIFITIFLLFIALDSIRLYAQAPLTDTIRRGPNDTILVGATVEKGVVYPMILLPEFVKTATTLDPEEQKRRDKLRSDIFTVYPYALTAAAVFKGINDNLDKIDRRHDRKKYLRSMDKNLDEVFKKPLKNLTIDQGHVLIKLINRQTGQNCYSIIKELKGGFSAVVWQSVGVLFNNNLNRDYDPDGDDKEIESIVKEMEASNLYRYQLYQQDIMMQKLSSRRNH